MTMQHENVNEIIMKICKKVSSHKLCYLFLLAVVVTEAYEAIINIQYVHILGLSPGELVNKIFFPEFFKYDYQLDGTKTLLKSSMMHIYPFLYETQGISALLSNKFVIFFEIILWTAAFAFYTRSVIPNKNHLFYALVLILYVSSWAFTSDLSRFGYMGFQGLYYRFADILSILSCLFFFIGKTFYTAILVGILFTLHPVIAFYTCFAILIIALIYYREYFHWKNLLKSIPFFIIAGAWFIFTYTESPTNIMEKSDWHTFVRFGNYHFFALNFNEFFLKAHLFPFLSFLALLLTSYIDYYRNQSSEIIKKLFTTLCALVAMSF